MRNFLEPLIPLGVESSDGRVVRRVVVNYGRMPLPVSARTVSGRSPVGHVSELELKDGVLYARGIILDLGAKMLDLGGSLAAEILTDTGELVGAFITESPAFNFKEKK